MIPLFCRAGEFRMRGLDHQSGSLFSYVDLEKRIRPDHPLRTIRRLVDDALASLDRAFADRKRRSVRLASAPSLVARRRPEGIARARSRGGQCCKRLREPPRPLGPGSIRKTTRT